MKNKAIRVLNSYALILTCLNDLKKDVIRIYNIISGVTCGHGCAMAICDIEDIWYEGDVIYFRSGFDKHTHYFPIEFLEEGYEKSKIEANIEIKRKKDAIAEKKRQQKVHAQNLRYTEERELGELKRLKEKYENV